MLIKFFLLLLIVAACLVDQLFSGDRKRAKAVHYELPRIRFRLRHVLLTLIVVCAALATARGQFALGAGPGIAYTIIWLTAYGIVVSLVTFVVGELWLGSRFARRHSLVARVRAGREPELPSPDAKGTKRIASEKTNSDGASRRPPGTPWWARRGVNRYRPYGGNHEVLGK